MSNGAEFDIHAKTYEESLDEALSVSGEKKNYFTKGRIDWLAQCLATLRHVPRSAMDFGCGTGSATKHLLGIPEVQMLVGVDVSEESLNVARRQEGSNRARFVLSEEFHPDEQIDLVFTNGTFHHIPVEQRLFAIDYIFRSLRKGGVLAFWENNPWNPGTRYIMRKCRFDEHAIPLSALEGRRLLSSRGFQILRTDFLFVFPNILSWLRGSERFVSRLPLGAQYQVLCRKPGGI